MSIPLVSVCMISYGHEAFIAQAIHGIMMQQTNFDFELIIANDCSPDNTDKVVKDLINSTYSNALITYYNHRENKGMYANFVFALAECKAKYVALCEGDDFWTDPLKLQKQVDFLEANPDYEVSFTNINIVDANGNQTKEKLISDGRKTTYEQKDLPIWAPTLTRVFRNRDFQNKLPNAPGLDTVMLLYQSRFGKIKFIDEVTGTYRLHTSGIFSSKSIIKKKEHLFLTSLLSLELISPSLYSKYFGILFKKLVDIRVLDKASFSSNMQTLKHHYKLHRSSMNSYDRIKIAFCFFLLKLGVFTNFEVYRKLSTKVINKLLIYKR